MQQTASIISLLKKNYPDVRIALNYTNTWELLVAVILSAQCTDVMVNKVTEKLFQKYPLFEDYLNVGLGEFEKDIRSTGFYHNKAKNILDTAKIIKEKFNSQVPQTMKELTSLSGVARKTANIILNVAFNKSEGIAVDTHVLRLSQRLGLVDTTKIGGKKRIEYSKYGQKRLDYLKDAIPVKVENELMETIPKKEWEKISFLLITHGRHICKSQNPKCGECFLNKICKSSRD